MTTDADYVKLAREQYHTDGEIEIDDGATVSRSSDEPGVETGAYVMAWVWVYKPEYKPGDGYDE
jgi:hypothetical protein